MNLASIRERVKALQAEIVELRVANEEYLSKYIHSPLVVHAQWSPELRLQQILNELARLIRQRLNEIKLRGEFLPACRLALERGKPQSCSSVIELRPLFFRKLATSGLLMNRR